MRPAGLNIVIIALLWYYTHMIGEQVQMADTRRQGTVSSLGVMLVDEKLYHHDMLSTPPDLTQPHSHEERGFFPQVYFDDPIIEARVNAYMDGRGLPLGFYALAGFDVRQDGRPSFAQILGKVGDVKSLGHADVSNPLGVHFYEAMCHAQQQEQAAFHTEFATPAHGLFVEATASAARSGILPGYLAKNAATLTPEALLKDDGFRTIADNAYARASRSGFATFAPDIPPAMELEVGFHEQLHLLERKRGARWGIDRSLPRHSNLAEFLGEGVVQHVTQVLMGHDINEICPKTKAPDQRTYLLNRYVIQKLCSNPDELSIGHFVDAAFSDEPPNLEYAISRTFGHYPRVLNELEDRCKAVLNKQPGAKAALVAAAYELSCI